MQKTLKNSIVFSGAGIHTGVHTSVKMKSAKVNTGIVFVRTDIQNKPKVKADINNLFSTSRSTVLKKGDAEIHTVEHLLAAIVGAEIDNIIIEIDNIEIPILDGSAKEFTRKIIEAELIEQEAEKNFLR